MSPDNTGIIGWQKNSFIDFPGTVSTVLFFRGCNLRCPYCHNPSIVRGEGEEVPFQSILDHLVKRRNFIEGVVLTGGEPTIHGSIIELRQMLKEMGLAVKLDTNGLLPGIVAQCAPDYLALDIKTLPHRYNLLGASDTRAAGPAVARTLSLVKQMGARAEVRITAAPGIIDKETITELSTMLDGTAKVYLQRIQFETELLDPDFCAAGQEISMEELLGYREIIAPRVGSCMIRGYD